MLRAVDSFYIYRVGEIAHVAIGTADAVMLRTRRIFDIPYSPRIIADKLEG